MSDHKGSLGAWPKEWVQHDSSSKGKATPATTSARSNHMSAKDNMKMQCTSSSMWLKSRYEKKNSQDNDTAVVVCKPTAVAPILQKKEMVKFASKARLLRQCTNCQVLYTSFHHCSINDDVAEMESEERAERTSLK